MDYSKIEETLKNVYYDPSNPASFSSAEKLYKEVNKDIHISIDQVKDWLKKQNTYTLHKSRKKNFVRNKVIVSKVNEQFQADIVDMQQFSRFNNGFKYILTVVDILSKYGFAIPLKTKTAQDVINAFKSIIKIRKPEKIQTDQGKEFVNSYFKKFNEENDIIFFTSKNQDIKCSNVERFNRTIKEKMWKYFTFKGTKKWIDILDDIVEGYNSSLHSSINMIPSTVNEDNSYLAFKNLYGFNTLREFLKNKSRKIIQKEGDLVRIPHKHNILEKGYYPKWKDQLFIVDKINTSNNKKSIKVKDQLGNIQKQTFYPEEVQVVKENKYRIEKILKKRKNNNKIEFLVKWLGYPDQYNSWEPEENIERFN